MTRVHTKLRALPLTLLLSCCSAALAAPIAPRPPEPDDKPLVAAQPPRVVADRKPTAGRLAIDKPTVDLGEIVRGQVASAVFEIRNTGSEVLRIFEARPG